MTNDKDERMVQWQGFRASARVVHALLKHVCAQPDSEAELAALVGALDPDEAEALLPEIEAEKKRREAWLARAGVQG